MTAPIVARALVSTLLTLAPIGGVAVAQCAASNGIGIPTDVFTINLTYESQVGPPPISQGISKWTSNCPGEGIEYPYFYLNSPADMNIHARFLAGRAPNDGGPCGCERTNIQSVGGVMTSATVRIYQQRCNGSPCGETSIDLLAHGYGHALGLTDVTAPNCDGTVMGRPLANQVSTVPSEVCSMFKSRWSYYDPYDCPGYVPPQECECYLAGRWPDYCHTPVVIDHAGEGFEFTGRHEEGVWFDFAGLGNRIESTWMASGTEQGFLCRDLTANQQIDSGRELFGNSTVLLNGTLAEHGYEALAELDSHVAGGNGDGFLDSGDGAYRELRIWFDRNGDGRTDADELATLADSGVVALGTEISVSEAVDPQGNLLPYWSQAWIRAKGGELRRVDTVDVIFIRLDD